MRNIVESGVVRRCYGHRTHFGSVPTEECGTAKVNARFGYRKFVESFREVIYVHSSLTDDRQRIASGKIKPNLERIKGIWLPKKQGVAPLRDVPFEQTVGSGWTVDLYAPVGNRIQETSFPDRLIGGQRCAVDFRDR